MADIQLTSAKLENGTLTVSGSGITKTTTQLYVDGNKVPHEVDPATGDMTAALDAGVSATEVYAIKDGVESNRVQVEGSGTGQPASDPSTAPGATEGDPQTGATGSSESPGTTTSTDDQSQSQAYDPGGDVHEAGYKTDDPNATPGDLVEDDLKTSTDVNLGSLANAPNAGPPATPQPDRTPLAEGEHLPAADFRTRVENTAAGDLNMDPRQPYPTGNPPDPQESRRRLGLPTTDEGERR